MDAARLSWRVGIEKGCGARQDRARHRVDPTWLLAAIEGRRTSRSTLRHARLRRPANAEEATMAIRIGDEAPAPPWMVVASWAPLIVCLLAHDGGRRFEGHTEVDPHAVRDAGP